MIITSDHGEAFGDHGHFGHGPSLYLEEIGVPLVILSPGARRAEWWRALSACATCLQPWSTCWGFRRARRSQAARWRPTGTRRPGKVPQGITSPALSEQADATAFQPQPGSGRGHIRVPDVPGGLGPSLPSGWHGDRALYDLRRDPFELVNLVGSSYDNQDAWSLPEDAPRGADR